MLLPALASAKEKAKRISMSEQPSPDWGGQHRLCHGFSGHLGSGLSRCSAKCSGRQRSRGGVGERRLERSLELDGQQHLVLPQPARASQLQSLIRCQWVGHWLPVLRRASKTGKTMSGLQYRRPARSRRSLSKPSWMLAADMVIRFDLGGWTWGEGIPPQPTPGFDTLPAHKKPGGCRRAAMRFSLTVPRGGSKPVKCSSFTVGIVASRELYFYQDDLGELDRLNLRKNLKTIP